MPDRLRMTSQVDGNSTAESMSSRPDCASSITERGRWQMYDW